MSPQVGILYHPQVPAAQTLSDRLSGVLQDKGYGVWVASAWEEKNAKHLMPGSDAVISIGGDGTILRTARAIIPLPIPILGIRFGRLGFLAEIAPDEALTQVPELLARNGPLEERSMLQATCALTKVDPELAALHHPLLNGDPTFHALNDVVVARGGAGRPIYIEVIIDAQPAMTYRADGVILATATGSTGYALSAGGPVLHPTSRAFVLIPVAPHANLSNAFTLEPSSIVQLIVHSDHGACISIDGQVDIPLTDGDTITVQSSPYTARFIRALPGDHFYSSLLARLRFGDNTAQ